VTDEKEMVLSGGSEGGGVKISYMTANELRKKMEHLKDWAEWKGEGPEPAHWWATNPDPEVGES
jgi:hypothetical protein